MSRRKWRGLYKVVEECGELIQELMKLHSYPDGKHPRRRRGLKISVEEEAADTLATIQYFIDKNKLDRVKIEKRAAAKYRKYMKRWGVTPQVAAAKKKAGKKVAKQASKRASKKRAAGQMPSRDASTHRETTR